LKDKTNFTELERHMEDAYRRLLDSAIFRFIKSQAYDVSWPDISTESFGSEFGPPKINNLIQIFHKAVDVIFPLLQ
jgi:hypothetical protein